MGYWSNIVGARAPARGIANADQSLIDDAGYHYEYVDVAVDRGARIATITVSAPRAAQPTDIEGIRAAGASWWPLAMARQLDDAILMLRTNDLDVGDGFSGRKATSMRCWPSMRPSRRKSRTGS